MLGLIHTNRTIRLQIPNKSSAYNGFSTALLLYKSFFFTQTAPSLLENYFFECPQFLMNPRLLRHLNGSLFNMVCDEI